ncbi:hypothetical protein WH52_04930 [Tenacibaculum holothuriorum]|uniref:Glycosyltransferase RgtA/B/C/D-like domain-containing protein n=1 Tax=Tenacibaculum holothuriorum TaxID=1635173 RepID=A0A1Y2PEZ3_9FLAO|nr:hypothetical protein WH52_04930 [Tenacibaculum holothuriorum]
MLCYVIKKKLEKKELLFSDFLVYYLSKYLAVSLIIVYLLIIIHNFNIFNYTVLLFIFFVFDYNQYKSPVRIYKELKEKFNYLLLKVIAFVESSDRITYLKEKNKDSKFNKKEITDFSITSIIVLITFFSRVQFYKNDIYLFSETWFEDLIKINDLNNQVWFSPDYSEIGHYAIINLFSNAFKISPENALQMFGLIQVTALSILIFWVVKKASKKTGLVLPIMASLIFTLGYTFTPINIGYLLKHQFIFSVLILILPAIVFLINKQGFKQSFKSKIIYLNIVLISSLLLNFSYTLILILVALSVVIVLNYIKKTKEKVTLLFTVLVSSLTLLFSFFVFYKYEFFNAFYFLKSSLLQVNQFSNLSHLLVPYETIIKLTALLSIIGLSSTKIENQKNKVLVIFSLLYEAVVILFFINIDFIDKDILLLIFSVLTPIVIALNSIQIIKVLSFKNKKVSKVLSGVLAIAIAFSTVFFQQEIVSSAPVSNETNRQILKAYNQITTTHLPFTYSVVNTNKVALIGNKKHYFINYSEFNSEYLERDYLYHKNKENKSFLEAHPEIILTSKVFVFEISDIDKDVIRTGISIPNNQLQNNANLLSELKKRGRKIRLYTQTPRLKVYEIINTENSSKISEMFF